MPRGAPSTWNCTDAIKSFVENAVAVTLMVPRTGAVPVGVMIDTAGGGLFTVTVTPADVVDWPSESVAIAERACEPLIAVVVFQFTEYGAVV